MEQENNILCCCWGRGEEQETNALEGPCSTGVSPCREPGCVRRRSKGEETSVCAGREQQESGETGRAPL